MYVGVVQMTSTDDVASNLAAAREGLAEAAGRGAQLVGLPEAFAFLRREGTSVPIAESLDGPIVTMLRRAAREHAIWIVGGSFPEAIEGSSRIHNTSVLVDPQGEVVARYRKIHLFDVALGERAEAPERGGALADDSAAGVYRESDVYAPGDVPVAAQTPFGGVGLSICYDLRFPELYRRLVIELDARWLFVPSAFTRETGKDHWEVLLRARAIENQCWVVAPAQCGWHAPDRASHGHSMIVDPWGVVIAQAADRPAVLVAACEDDAVDRVRRAIPALRNRRL